MEAAPSPSLPPVRGQLNVEEVAAPPKQSEEEVERAGRKSSLMQLQMIIEFGEIESVSFFFFLICKLVFLVNLHTRRYTTDISNRSSYYHTQPVITTMRCKHVTTIPNK